nr:MAG TPA: putative ATPase [Caudoviricetes sp.]
MKLVKIFSNKKEFKEIEFNEHFNIIVGKKTKESNDENSKKKDSHNLGKTSLVNLIDFLLLKRMEGENIFKKHSDLFKEHIFYLELLLDSGKYLLIKRSVEKNTKISFALLESKLEKIDEEKIVWEHVDLPYEKSKKILNNIYLNFNVLKEYDYRTYLRMIFLKDKDSFSKKMKNPYKGSDFEWKSKLLYLFGFDNRIFEEKKKLEEKLEVLKKESPKNITTIIDKKRSEILEFEDNISELEKNIDVYNDYSFDKNVTEETVKNISNEISRYNQKRYNLSIDIKKISTALEEEINAIDLEQLENIFKEVNLYFPKQLKKNYEELIEFNKIIFVEREGALKNKLLKLSEESDEVNQKLEFLNKQREKNINILNENEFYKKKAKEIVELEIQKEKLEKLKIELEELEKKLESITEKTEIENEHNTIVGKLEIEISKDNEIYNDIKKIFQKITKKIFPERNGRIIINLNKEKNPEFDLYLEDKLKKRTSEDDGGTYKGILMACFCLSIASYYSKFNYHKFLFQDGMLEGGDNRKKKLLIELIKKVCAEYDLQYITTAIEDEINDNEVKKLFDEENIIAKLTDEDNGKGTLFGFQF